MISNLSVHTWNDMTLLKLAQDNMGVCLNDDMIEFIDSLDLKNKNVVDGGSNIGIFSLYMSKKCHHVYAFELQPFINKLAIDNAELNKIENISFSNAALSTVSGNKVGFTYIDYEGKNISSVGIKTEPSLKGQPHCGEIETIALDDMCIGNVGLIKLDLEGAEQQALEGMWDTIRRCKPPMIIELSPIYLEHQEQKTIDKIISHGYKVKELTDCNYVFEPI